MNVLSTTLRQLVRYKLWPVAVLLLAALVAVPVLLAREPAAPEPLAPLPVATEADDTIAEPVVAKVTPEDRDRRRRVLGARKDPFQPAPVKKAKTAKAGDEKVAPSSTPAPSTGGDVPTGGAPAVSEPAPKKVYYEPGTIIVRFGEASETGDLRRFAISKLSPVPDEEFPVLVYMGLTRDGKKAKFLVDATIEAEGDGDCKPHPSNCEIIELAVGETEFLDVLNPETDEDAEAEEDSEEPTDEESEPDILASYQLDLVDIKRAGDADVK
jgi:hypothetical protein